ncbi:MAG: hypothetical protein DHS20C11_23280 [Lysobacteraceae bacterium]|nr:MAG: hypothetical protein DHS20C11_23280 [Xanthomonadaceae bacterium]
MALIRQHALGVLVVCCALVANGCTTVINTATSGLGESLTAGILNQSDPEIVRSGAPAYLLLVDGLIRKNPDNVALLLAGAQLYGAYSSAFVDDEERANRLSQQALNFSRRAVCEREQVLCQVLDAPYEQYVAALNATDEDSAEALYVLGQTWGTWIQRNTDDWGAVAAIPNVEATIERVVDLDPDIQRGWPHVYLGVLATLMPESYGGRPQQGRQHFEKAIAMSNQQNLMAKVLFARHYARLVFDQSLHDELLQQVLDADVQAPDLTLSNVMAQQLADQLLAESKDYF